MNIESGIHNGGDQVADLTSQTLIDQIKTSEEGLSNLEVSSLDPESPIEFYYEWTGSEIDKLAVITPDPQTRYTDLVGVPNTTPLWFRTKDVASISPNTSGEVGDVKSIGADTEVVLATATPTFTYATPATEHLVTWANFDPLAVTDIDFRSDGITEIDISALKNVGKIRLTDNPMTEIIGLETLDNVTDYKFFLCPNLEEVHIGDGSNALTFQTYSCASLTTLSGTETLTGLVGGYFAFASNLTGELVVPIAVNCVTFRAETNPITSTTTFLGCLAITDLRLSACALVQTTVDMIFNDMATNGMSSGSINVAGGTSAKRTLASLDSYNQLILNSVTLVDNGIESTEGSMVWFKTKDDASINPAITTSGSTGDWVDNDGQLYESSNSPTFTFGTPANEHLISLDNIDPLDILSANFSLTGLTIIDISAGLSNCGQWQSSGNALLLEIVGSETLTGLTSNFYSVNGDLTGELKIPIAPQLDQIQIQNNPNLSSTTTFVGNVELDVIRIDGCALDLATVDMIFDDMVTNGMTSGSINLSGGTNAIPSPATISGSILTLTNAGVTCTYNT
jgi:hypothetical protein